MNKCADDDAKRVEKELNRTFEDLLQRAAKIPAALAKIRAAQAAWMAYRDAHIQAMFAADNKQAVYGTVYPMCAQMLRDRLALERMKELKAMMSRPDAGSVCSGDRYVP
jgi:uncharacterized protein YecT (DUF1311 family)